jgi:homoserine dehydrogenase
MSIDAAVLEAQSRGLAEADASADIDGQDAADKLSILTYRAFGAWVRPTDFPVRGIRDLTPADCDLAEAMGCRIRLIARAARFNGSLDMAVEPLLLPSWHLLASVEEEYNAVYLRCASSGDLSLFGMGAGAMPTATAVLGDLIDLAQDNSVRWPEPRALPLARPGGAVEPAPRRHFLRVAADAHPGLERRVDSLVRRLGLMAQNQVARADHDCLYLAFMISPCSDQKIGELQDAVSRLARVRTSLCLGVLE